MYDIIFIGDKSSSKWHELKTRFVTAKQASCFESARKQCLTPMFWAVYDDIHIKEDWQFDYAVDRKSVV